MSRKRELPVKQASISHASRASMGVFPILLRLLRKVHTSHSSQLAPLREMASTTGSTPGWTP
eukprot:5514132-Pyramimonas_sp.AAC.2